MVGIWHGHVHHYIFYLWRKTITIHTYYLHKGCVSGDYVEVIPQRPQCMYSYFFYFIITYYYSYFIRTTQK